LFEKDLHKEFEDYYKELGSKDDVGILTTRNGTTIEILTTAI
jgi:hypothetical protein